MKTLKNPHCSSFKGDNLDLKAPGSWGELTQEQLRYVFFLMSTFESKAVIKTYMLFRFTGITVNSPIPGGVRCSIAKDGNGRHRIFNLSSWQIQSLVHQFDYIDSCDDMGVRLDKVCDCHAVDVILREVCFSDYLACERSYQMFLETKEVKYIYELGRLLYRKEDGGAPDYLKMTAAERTGVFCWYTYIKAVYVRMFPYFFKPAGENGVKEFDFLKVANAQVRALTDGDITKESAVEAKDCLRALTELNEKAREAAEFRRKYGDK